MFITTRIGRFALITNSCIIPFSLSYKFSNLKDNYAELRSVNYPTISQFYVEMRKFQSNLPYTEWVKFKKLIHQANKKVRKFSKTAMQNTTSNSQNQDLFEIPYTMDGSITSEYFYHKHTETIYYKEQIPYHKLGETKAQIKTLSIQKIEKLVEKYLKNDMEPYLFKIVPFEQEYSEMMKLIHLRYEAVEQIVCRHIFQGYTQFTNQQENLFFKTEQKYKGNFKFQPISPNSQQNKKIIHKFSIIAKNLACLSQCSSKILLAAQMLLSQHWKDLQSQTLSNLLFCTSANGKDLHQITTNIDQFASKMLASDKSSQYFSLMLYMCISGVQNRQILEKADQKLAQASKFMNAYEKLILSAMIHYLSQVKQVDFTKIPKSQLLQFPRATQSDCLKSFKKFLDQRHYQYEILPQSDKANIIGPYQMIQIQQKKFVCYSSLFYQPSSESNALNGLAKLINEYFNSNNQKIKIINGKQLASIQKWTQKQEYLKTKMKGLTKPQIKKQRKFDFYSPREEYFDKKEQQKR